MAEMTSLQRVMTTAMGQEPDRVPVASMFNDWSWGQLYGKDSYQEYSLDPERFAKAILWGCTELGFDTAGLNADTMVFWEAIAEASDLGHYSALRWDDYLPTHPHRLYSGDPIKEIAYGDPLVKTLEDAKKLKPADPYKHGRMPVILKTIEIVMKELGGKYPVGGVADNPVHVGGCLMGWTQMFMAMEKDLELWKTVEEVVVQTVYEFAKAQIKLGVKGLGAISELPQKVGSEEFFKHPAWMEADHPPGIMKRIWEEFKVPTALHPCTVGPLDPGIEVWKTYLDHTFSFAMPEYGGADALARAKKELAPATVSGNVHPIDVLLMGTTSDVEDACIELIQKCGPGGRFVLAPGCGIPLDTPFENVQTMVKTARKYGQYPIRL